MNERTLHMIGNAHIDPVWLWQWQEGFHEVKATFRSALDRMKTFEDFVFVASSAAFYAWVEHSDPDMFAEIQQRVAEGRWQIVGGWWVEPDCNIPSGESFVRHGLYAQRYFLEKFGVLAKTGFNIDSFGHSGSLPQILKKSGIEQYVFLRPGPHEKADLPSRLFQWEAPDGSRVIAFQIPFRYESSGHNLLEHIARCADEIKAPLNESMCFFGVGNHGGGPTIENIRTIQDINHEGTTPAKLAFSAPDRFFDRVREAGIELPVVHDELQHHASGCYSVHSGIKQWNRLAENQLIAAEKWSVLADQALNSPYPANFAHAWKQLLFNQFHDIMAGTSLESAYLDARNNIGEVLSIAGRSHNDAVQAFAWNIQIPEQPEARPIAVFNPLTWETRATIEIESQRWPEESVLVDENNTVVPYQALHSHSMAGKMRLCFTAHLPALGYRTYRLITSGPLIENQPTTPAQHPLLASDTVLENQRLRLEIDPISGAILSLRDKKAQLEVFASPAALPVVLEDPGDTWAHGVFRWDQEIGHFNAKTVSLIESGPVKSTIRVISTYGQSQLIQEFSLSADSDQIDVRVQVDWHETLKMLKLRFPTNIHAKTATAENAYGHIERSPNGDEESMQRWVDVSGTACERGIPYGLSILNNGKYSVDVNAGTISLTVLRSPVYAHHDPNQLQPDGFYSYIDQGRQEFQYALVPHTDSWREANTIQRAEALNQPPTALFATFHPTGKLPQQDSFITVDSTSVLVTALKQAEDGNGLIVRAVESFGQPAQAAIHLPHFHRTITVSFGPAEIKTFFIPADSECPVREVNLLEQEVEAG